MADPIVIDLDSDDDGESTSVDQGSGNAALNHLTTQPCVATTSGLVTLGDPLFAHTNPVPALCGPSVDLLPSSSMLSTLGLPSVQTMNELLPPSITSAHSGLVSATPPSVRVDYGVPGVDVNYGVPGVGGVDYVRRGGCDGEVCPEGGGVRQGEGGVMYEVPGFGSEAELSAFIARECKQLFTRDVAALQRAILLVESKFWSRVSSLCCIIRVCL